jgi:hypothetical protein
MIIVPLKGWNSSNIWEQINVSKFYSGKNISRLNSANVCLHSMQNVLSSSLLSKNIKIKIHRTIILPVVLYGCETLSPTLREELSLRVFDNRVLKIIFGLKRQEVTGGGGKYIMRSLMICTPYQILFE